MGSYRKQKNKEKRDPPCSMHPSDRGGDGW
jgi:hypothetical protein